MSVQRIGVADGKILVGGQEWYVIQCDWCGRETPAVKVDSRLESSAKAGLRRLRQMAKDMDFAERKDKHFCSACFYEWDRRAVPYTPTLFDLSPETRPRRGA